MSHNVSVFGTEMCNINRSFNAILDTCVVDDDTRNLFGNLMDMLGQQFALNVVLDAQ